MTWLKGMLIALGLVAVIAIGIVASLGLLSSDKGHEIRHISIGQRTISVSHYKGFTQETTADGVKMVVDGHTITATPDEITIDGAEQDIAPDQDVEIVVDEAGKVTAKAATAEPSDDVAMPPDGDGSENPPPQ
jgi:hypothetical protein